MVAGQAMYRRAGVLESRAKRRVATGVVMHEVSRQEYGAGTRMPAPRVGDAARERRLGRDAPHLRARCGGEMRVRELQCQHRARFNNGSDRA